MEHELIGIMIYLHILLFSPFRPSGYFMYHQV